MIAGTVLISLPMEPPRDVSHESRTDCIKVSGPVLHMSSSLRSATPTCFSALDWTPPRIRQLESRLPLARSTSAPRHATGLQQFEPTSSPGSRPAPALRGLYGSPALVIPNKLSHRCKHEVTAFSVAALQFTLAGPTHVRARTSCS